MNEQNYVSPYGQPPPTKNNEQSNQTEHTAFVHNPLPVRPAPVVPPPANSSHQAQPITQTNQDPDYAFVDRVNILQSPLSEAVKRHYLSKVDDFKRSLTANPPPSEETQHRIVQTWTALTEEFLDIQSAVPPPLFHDQPERTGPHTQPQSGPSNAPAAADVPRPLSPFSLLFEGPVPAPNEVDLVSPEEIDLAAALTDAAKMAYKAELAELWVKLDLEKGFGFEQSDALDRWQAISEDIHASGGMKGMTERYSKE